LLSGDYTTNLIITEGDNDTYTIPVSVNIPIYPDTSMAVTPLVIYDTLKTNESSLNKIVLYNSGTVDNIYHVTLDINNGSGWITLNKHADTIESLQTDTLLITLNNNNLTSGNYSCTIFVTEQDNDVHYVNVYLNIPVINNIDITDTKSQIQVFPNPFSDYIDLIIKIDNSDSAIVQLYTLTGELVYQKTESIEAENSYIKIDSLQKLTNGTYILRIILNNSVYTIPIIKNQ
ncbi:MAG: T9SS type A sorting domain-containing protein, partial [Bacteroidales bacterium]|nr:T9SS type A sorting domain-containing protein [Bacteroidales bacterium]